MAAPFVWGEGGAQMTPEQIAAQRKVAQALMEKGMDYSPIQSPWQGAARVSQALLGGLESGQADEAARTNAAADREMIASLIGGGGATPATTGGYTAGPVLAPPSEPQIVPADQFNSIDAMADLKPETAAMLPRAQGAISNIESGGRYDIKGPVTASGDQALGKYQVMGANVAPWTKEVMGRAMTPQEFISSPDAQDAVFNGKFGQYAEKYGAPGASKAWFAGEGGMKNPNAKDQLGTTVMAYADKFTGGMGDEGSLPTAARPTQATARPATGGPMAGVNPKVIEAATSPYSSPQTKAIANIILQQQMKQSDYDIQQRPDGSVIAVNKKNPNDLRVLNAPGAGESAIKFEAAKAAAVATAKGNAEKMVGKEDRDKEQRQVGNVVTQDIDRAISKIDNSTLPTTGMVGQILSNFGGTAARDVGALIDTVKANAGFAELQKMRNNSPTGGALGQVSEREIAYLQATIGNLEQSQSDDQLKDNLRRVKNNYMDIIHGEGKGPPREKLQFQENVGTSKPATAPPQAGEVKDGYRFKGGNPADRNSWERVN
jgi:hypothetical protein